MKYLDNLMISKIFTRFTVSILVLLIGCKKTVETAKYEIPIYRECVAGVEDYVEFVDKRFSASRYKESFEIKYFDAISPAHESIVGYLVLRAYWSGVAEDGSTPYESLEIHANSVKASCFPETEFSFDLDINRLGDISALYDKNKRKGIDKIYLEIKDGQLKIYFNDGKYDLPSATF